MTKTKGFGRGKMKYLFLIFILSGCELKTQIKPEREKIYNYKCQQENLFALEAQYKICDDSGYLSSTCYLHGLISFCDYVGPK